MDQGPLQGPISPDRGRRPQAGTRRLLIIDGNRDVCEMLALALTNDGYTVDCGFSGRDALALLGKHRYGLVIGDYELPDGTAASWIAAATRGGLLESTPILIETAHPDPQGIETFEVLRRPFVPDQLLQQVRRMVERGRARRRRKRPAPAASQPVVELVLYVSPGVTASEDARRHLEELTARCADGSHSLTVLDVALHGEEAEADKVVFTPTLVKRRPPPETWVVGDMSVRDQLDGLFEVWGLGGRKRPGRRDR